MPTSPRALTHARGLTVGVLTLATAATAAVGYQLLVDGQQTAQAASQPTGVVATSPSTSTTATPQPSSTPTATASPCASTTAFIAPALVPLMAAGAPYPRSSDADGRGDPDANHDGDLRSGRPRGSRQWGRTGRIRGFLSSDHDPPGPWCRTMTRPARGVAR